MLSILKTVLKTIGLVFSALFASAIPAAVAWGVWICVAELFGIRDIDIKNRYFFIALTVIIPIIVICVVINAIRDFRKENALLQKYQYVIGGYPQKEWAEKLHQAGRQAMLEGSLTKAREYLEASGDLDIVKVGPDLIRCYHAMGNLSAAKALVKRLFFGKSEERNYEAGVLAITLGLDSDPARIMRLLKDHFSYSPDQKSQIPQQLWEQAEALTEQCVLQEYQKKLRQETEYCDTRLQKAQKLMQEGNFAAAIKVCDEALKYVTDDCRDTLKNKLVNLAWIAANCAYQQKYYETTLKYLDMEDCSCYPTEYYLRVRAKTHDGLQGSYDEDGREQETDAACRAANAGLPGAEEFKRELLNTHIKILDALIHVEKQKIADIEFEEEYGMSREEYANLAERQRQIAAKQTRAKAEALQDTWKQLELDAAERYYDVRSGGDGLTMEEKFQRGKIDRADYYRHKAARDKH